MDDSPPIIQPVEVKFEVTQLGAGILKSSLSPEEGLLVYVDL
jgi:hypothetical protein